MQKKSKEVMEILISSGTVAELIGVSIRQLQYWRKIRLVESNNTTPGGHYRYTNQDLAELKNIKRLIDSGVSTQQIRSCLVNLAEFFPSIKRPLCELDLAAIGGMVFVFLSPNITSDFINALAKQNKAS